MWTKRPELGEFPPVDKDARRFNPTASHEEIVFSLRKSASVCRDTYQTSDLHANVTVELVVDTALNSRSARMHEPLMTAADVEIPQ